MDRAPRRVPRQSRSRETVDAIIEGTDRLLRAGSAGRLTMRAVAELSGVSMGTLYQYFGTREALLAGWEERVIGRLLSRVLAVAAKLSEAPPSMESAIFTVVFAATELCEEHMAAYPSAEPFFFARMQERHESLERAAAAIVTALDNTRGRARLRAGDRLATARLAVLMVPNLARALVNFELPPEAKESMRRQLASMLVFSLVADADEANFVVHEVARAEGQRGAKPSRSDG